MMTILVFSNLWRWWKKLQGRRIGVPRGWRFGLGKRGARRIWSEGLGLLWLVRGRGIRMGGGGGFPRFDVRFGVYRFVSMINMGLFHRKSKVVPSKLLLEILYLISIRHVLGIRFRRLGRRRRVLLRIPLVIVLSMAESAKITLLNQSDISDLVEKSFSNCCWISRAVFHQWILLPHIRLIN